MKRLTCAVLAAAAMTPLTAAAATGSGTGDITNSLSVSTVERSTTNFPNVPSGWCRVSLDYPRSRAKVISAWDLITYPDAAVIFKRYDVRVGAFYQGMPMKVSSMVSPGYRNFNPQTQSIMNLQAVLCRSGYSLIVDGQYGPATRSAVIAYQRKHGLTADGIAGTRTLNNMGMKPVSTPPGVEPYWHWLG